MPEAPALVLENFKLIQELSCTLHARLASLEWSRNHLDMIGREALGRELAEFRPLTQDIERWTKEYWAGQTMIKLNPSENSPDLGMALQLLETCAEDLETEALALEAILEKKPEELQRLELVRLATAMLRAATRDELILKSAVTLSRQFGLADELKRRMAGTPDPEPRLMAARRWALMFEKSEALDAWELTTLYHRCHSLPAVFRQASAELRVVADEIVTGQPASLTPESQAEWMEKNFDPAQAAAWMLAGFTRDEAADWATIGADTPSVALEWASRGYRPAGNAEAWIRAGILAEEAACFEASGLLSEERAIEIHKALGGLDGWRVWHRAGFSDDESLAWRRAGAKSTLQAMAHKSKGLTPELLAEQNKNNNDDLAVMSGVSKTKELPLPSAPAVAPESPAPPTPSALGEAPAIKLAWVKAGVQDAAERQAWIAAGFDPTGAAPWVKELMRPQDAAAWKQEGFDTVQAIAWQEAGVTSPANAAAWKNGGANDPGIAGWLETRMAKTRCHCQAAQMDVALPHPTGAGAALIWGFGVKAWSKSPEEPEAKDWVRRATRKDVKHDPRRLGAVLGVWRAPELPYYVGIEESETFAWPAHFGEIKQTQPLPTWPESLRTFAMELDALGPDPSYLLASAGTENLGQQKPVVFWGVAFEAAGVSPWQESMDFNPRETWLKRWQRKCDEWSQPELEAKLAFGVSGVGDAQRHFLYYLGSEKILSGEKPELWEAAKVDADWKDTFEEFCQIMDLPLKKPGWQLGVGELLEK